MKLDDIHNHIKNNFITFLPGYYLTVHHSHTILWVDLQFLGNENQ